MHKEGEDSLTLALTPFTIVTNSKSPIHVYIHIFIKTVTKIKIQKDTLSFQGSFGVLWAFISSSLLPLRRKISPMTVHFALKLILFRKLNSKPVIIYDHALI